MKIINGTTEHVDSISDFINSLELDCLTIGHLKNDCANNNLLVAIDNGVVLGFCALLEDLERNQMAIKRFAIVKNNLKSNMNKDDVIDRIFNTAIIKTTQNGFSRIGATPWTTNIPMTRTFEKQGFTLQYVFNDVWGYYSLDI